MRIQAHSVFQDVTRCSTLGLGVPLLALALLSAGCSTTSISTARKAHSIGAFAEAAEAMSKVHPQDETGLATENRDEDNIWLLLEKAKMCIDAGDFDQSMVAVTEANRILETIDEEALISLGQVGSGLKGTLFDDRQLDYVGTSYDRILLSAYAALSLGFQGNLELAAVAAREQADWQRIAEKARMEQISKQQAVEAKARKGGASISYANFMSGVDEENQSAFEDAQHQVAALSTSAYADYSIPFGRYVGALVLHAAGYEGEAGAMLSAVRGMAPSCSPLKESLGKPRTAYVIFETGQAPYRTDASFSFTYTYTAIRPVYNDAGKKIGEEEVQVPSSVKVAIPSMEMNASATARSLRVSSGDQIIDTTKLHDLSGIVAMEFEEALSGIWFRTIAGVIIKEIAQVKANEKFGFIAVIGGGIAKNLAKPDLRGWQSLPAQHQIAVVPVPQNGELTCRVVGPNGQLTAEVTLMVPVGPPILVFARSTDSGNLIVHACSLEREARP